MYFVLFVIGERLHHYLLTITKEKSKPTEEGKALQFFTSDTVTMMGGSYTFALVLVLFCFPAKRRKIMETRS